LCDGLSLWCSGMVTWEILRLFQLIGKASWKKNIAEFWLAVLFRCSNVGSFELVIGI